MNTPSLPVVTMASISFYVGLYHLLIYYRRRQHREDLTFALLCLATSLYDVFCIGLYNVTAVAEGVRWQRAQFIALALFTTAFMWFVSDYTHQKPRLVIYAFSAFYLLAILIQIVDRSNLTWMVNRPSIKEVLLPLGLKITYHEATFGPFTTVQSLTGMVASTYILLSGIRFYRRGYKREAGPLLLAMGFVYASAFNDTAVSNGLYQFAYMIEYGFMAMILLMAYSLSNTVVEAAMAKEALRASEERFRSLVETTNDWVWETDRNGSYTYASPKVSELLGYEPEKVIGMTPFDLMLPDEAERIGPIFRDIVDSQRPFERLENTARHQDGRLVVLETNGVPFFDVNGKLLGYRGIDRDITERKRAEEVVRESEERFRSVVENSPTGIFIVNDASQFTYANDELCRILGYPRAEIIGHDFREFLDDESQPIVVDRYVRRQRGEDVPPRYEFNIVRKDGEKRRAEISSAVIKDSIGNPRTMGQLLDITERERVEESLRQANETLQALFDYSPLAIIMIALDGRILLWNKAAERMFGWTSQEVLGTFTSIVPEEKLEEYREFQQRVNQGETLTGLELVSRRKDGTTFSHDLSVAPLRDSTGAIYAQMSIGMDVTERKKAAEALRESEERFRLFMRHFPGLAYIKDAATHVLFANQGFMDYLNIAPSAILGKTNQDIFPSEFAKQITVDDRRILESGASEVIEERYGERIWSTYKFAIPQTDQPSLLGGFTIDITERKRAEEALREKTAELDQYFTNALDLLCIADTDGYFRRLNKEWESTLGYSIQELEGTRFLDYVHPDDRESTLAAISRLGEQEEVLNFANRYRSKDGSYRWVEWRSSPVGKTVYAVARDITERKRVEAELQASESRYRALVESQIDLISRYLPDTTLTFVNDAYCQFYGKTREELIGHSFLSMVAPEFHEQTLKETEGFVRDPRPIGGEYLNFRNDGTTCWIQWVIQGIVDENGRVVELQAVGRDITRLKQAEAEREKLIADLEAKNAELERFTYTVSHDLKAPLITIRGFMGFVEKDALAGNLERLRHDMDRIIEATDRMQRLLNELLELSRIGQLMNPFQSVSFEMIVREALELVRGRITSRSVQVEIAEGLPTLFGDRARLVEAVQNLIDNAVKFMGEQPNPRIEIGASGTDANGNPVFFVQDNGIGIDPKYHEQIFGLFNKLDAQTEGTGVGLALVRRIIEGHGGRIWVESHGAGQGAAFCFTLPVRV